MKEIIDVPWNKSKMKIEKVFQVIYSNKFISLIGIILISIIFKIKLEQIFINYFIIDSLDKIESILLNDIFFLFINVFILLFLFRKLYTNYIPGYWITALSFLAILAYIYYRLYRVEDLKWNLTEFSYFNKLKYSDTFLIFCTSNLLIALRSTFTKVSPPIKEQGSFEYDEQLGKEGSDLFGRQLYCTEIAKKILLSNGNHSFAIGINGKWGSGKSSFFDLVKRGLLEQEKGLIIIDFNPWKSNNATSIIDNFFTLLKDNLKPFSATLSNQLANYSDKLIEANNNFITKTIKHALDIIFGKAESIQEQFYQINDTLKKINKKIIVFIDDLDRLDSKESIEVIRLIRNTANFNNTFFIVAYDRNYLIQAIENLNINKKEFFLEKIFQLELTLPRFEQVILRNKLLELLKNNISEIYYKKLEDHILDTRNNKHVFLDDFISTLRDVSRFINSFTLSQLDEEIEISDLFDIELIKLKYPGAYELIFNRKNDFLQATTSRTYKDKFYYVLSCEKNQHGEPIKGAFMLEKFIESEYKNMSIPKEHIKIIVRALDWIFSDKHPKRSHLSIIYPSSFERYSSFRLLNGNLSEKQFSNYRLKTEKEFNDQIFIWVNNGLRNELKKRFSEINDYDNRNDFEKVIRAIFFLANIPGDKEKADYDGYDANDLEDKLSDNREKISKLYYKGKKNEYYEFILSIFEQAKSPYFFEIELIYHVLSSITFDFILPKEKLNEIRLGYLAQYLKSVNLFDSNIWHLYHYCDLIEWKETSSQTRTKEEIKNPIANQLLFEFLNVKDLNGFLFEIIVPERFDKNAYAISGIVKEIFGSYEEFKIFLKRFDEKRFSNLKEFNELFMEFEKGDYKKYIEFNFKEIPIGQKLK